LKSGYNIRERKSGLKFVGKIVIFALKNLPVFSKESLKTIFLSLWAVLLFFHDLLCSLWIQSTFRHSLVKKCVINDAQTDQLYSKNFHCCFNAVSFIQGATDDPTNLSTTHDHSVLKGLSAEKRIKSISFVLAVLQDF